MRVIAGIYRSRLLAAPRGMATRPTSDRLRETLFNVLAPRIEGARFADLYAGSGAVGIEALSRGAVHVTFAESAAPAVAALHENLASLGIRSGFTVEACTVSAALRVLVQRPGSFDILFLDPPYEHSEEYAKTLSVLGEHAASLLAPGGLVVAEHRRKMPEPLRTSYGALTRFRLLEQGDASLSFYRQNEPEL